MAPKMALGKTQWQIFFLEAFRHADCEFLERSSRTGTGALASKVLSPFLQQAIKKLRHACICKGKSRFESARGRNLGQTMGKSLHAGKLRPRVQRFTGRHGGLHSAARTWAKRCYRKVRICWATL